MSTERVDVVVVGGGPGGSTLASLVAMQGHHVIILEKEAFPRYQIGESLLPSTVHGICRMVGIFDELANSDFTVKRGGTFRWGSNQEPWTFAFSLSDKMAAETSYAYQVERSRFDKILLDNARRIGVDVREKCTVTNVLAEQGRICGVTYKDADGNTRKVHAKYVVDASGNSSRIYKYVGGERKYSDFFRSLAIFAYFEGGKRLPSPNSGNILSVAFDSGWFWYIPLTSTLTSVGAVVRREFAAKVRGNPHDALQALIEECPLIKKYLKDAKRIVEGQYGEIRVRKDYSYHNSKFWCPGMILIGDAACFVDPVFSSGVHLATYSALLAARSINSVMMQLVEEQTAFREFELRYRREYRMFYEFLMSFYDINVSEESYFWSAKKVTKSTQSELTSFVELVGGISSGEAALTTADSLIERFKNRSIEFANAIDAHVADKERSMLPLFKSELVRDVMAEGTRVQAGALLGTEAGSEHPLFDSGLIPSPDGMLWSAPATIKPN
jgi:FAD-dependent halogenase